MKQGFTLIEIIAVLVLVSVLVLASTIALLPMAEGFLQMRRNVDASQKSHLAMSRIVREFTAITNVVSGGQRTITYDSLDPAGSPYRRTLTWDGNAGSPLTLSGAPLSDDVRYFELRYYASPEGAATTAWNADTRLVEVILGTLSGGETYTNRIVPRNLTRE